MNKPIVDLIEIRREKLKTFLLECNHYDKDRIVRGAKNRGIFGDNQDNEQVYDTIVKFAKTNNIPIHVSRPEIFKFIHPTENVFIEEIDKDGNSVLKKVGEDSIKEQSAFLETLEKERENLSNKLIRVNKLIELYKL